MMQGISTLPGAQQAPQQAPGQAMPFQATPQQQPQTPQAMTGQLQNLPPQQLLQMFANPADKTPKWAVVTAYAKAIEQQRLMEAASGQQAMQQGQMQAQQPPVAAQVMMQRPTQMARHGGIMHGYAGGGAVAFEDGGRVQRFSPGGLTTGFAPDYQAMRAVGINISPYDSPEVRADKIRRFEEFRRTGQVPPPRQEEPEFRAEGASPEEMAGSSVVQKPRSSIIDLLTPNVRNVASQVAKGVSGDRPNFYGEEIYGEPRRSSAQSAAQATETPERFKDTRQIPVGIATPPSPPTRVAAATGQAAAPSRGFPAPQESPDLRRRIDDANRIAREQAKLTDEERAARGGLDALSAQIIAERRAEEARRLAQAESRMGEARTRATRSPLDDIAFLGQMIEGTRGAKRFGEGLAGAASGAGRAQAAREEALRKAEEKYDLSRNEIANLANLRQQVQMDQAKLVDARATRDADKIRAAEMQAAASQVELAKYEQTLGIEGRKLDLEELKIRTQQGATAAASAQANQQRLMTLLANAEARKQELVRNITKNYKDSKKMVYSMADVPNAPKEAVAAKDAADRELERIIKTQTADIDRLMAQTAAQIPGFGGLYQRGPDLVFDAEGNPVTRGR